MTIEDGKDDRVVLTLADGSLQEVEWGDPLDEFAIDEATIYREPNNLLETNWLHDELIPKSFRVWLNGYLTNGSSEPVRSLVDPQVAAVSPRLMSATAAEVTPMAMATATVTATAGTEGTLMTAAKVALKVEQGATKKFSLLWGSGTSETDLVPYDLTGCKARMMFKKQYTDTTPILSATTEDGGIILQPNDGSGNPQKGMIQVYLTDEKTDAITETAAVWDLEVEWPSGDVDRVAEGAVTISPSVTRP